MKHQYINILIMWTICLSLYGNTVLKDSTVIIHQKQIDQIRHDLRQSAKKIPDSELETHMAQFKSDTYYHIKLSGKERETILPVLMAGLERHPEDPHWIGTLYMFPSSDLSNAKRLSPEEKKEHCLYTLAYLMEAVDIMNTTSASDTDPNQKDNEYARMLQHPMALAAMEAGEWDLSKHIAAILLLNNNDPNSWNYGNVIHKANTVLGQVALREKNINKAKYHLIESGNTPGSPQLNSFGPSFALAGELLEKGEKEAVLQYLDLVAVFWANPDIKKPQYKHLAEEHAEKLSKWKQEIKTGRIPDDWKWR